MSNHGELSEMYTIIADSIRLAWSPDGRYLAFASKNGNIHLWDQRSGKTVIDLASRLGVIYSIAWSPDGRFIAAAGNDVAIQLWDAHTGAELRTLEAYHDFVHSVTWSPDGRFIAAAGNDVAIQLWDAHTGAELRALTGHEDWIYSTAWSPDGRFLASAGHDGSIRIWDPITGREHRAFSGRLEWVNCIAWSPDERFLASAGHDRVIRIWDPYSGQETWRLEGHTGDVAALSFLSDASILASQSGTAAGAEVCLWRTATWELLISEPTASTGGYMNLAFSPSAPLLAGNGKAVGEIRIWSLDVTHLLQRARPIRSEQYTNAKVVLVGDSGVGKSGLSLVLSGQAFQPTESTHGRHIWTLAHTVVELEDRKSEQREILLWDLAGQPGYRLIHQLHLNEVAVALVVFDRRSELDPFAGVHHWARALRQSQRAMGNHDVPMKKFLVAARSDRGGVGAASERVAALIQELGFDGFFETSAKEGTNIEDLRDAIEQGVQWEALPKVSSSLLFQRIKAFLIAQKASGRVIIAADALYQSFVQSSILTADAEVLRAQFDTCIGLVESRNLIQRLSFGDLVLLEPELIDAYASALVNSVKDEPDGLGSITEERIIECDFSMPSDERLDNRGTERLLLIAMVEDLVRHELALREHTSNGSYIVFPSQSTRASSDAPGLQQRTTVFEFEGAVLNIYATLAVRLSHSEFFQKKELWKHAISYRAAAGGTCGISLQHISEGRAELSLFFDANATEETRFHFEQYVASHLKRTALPDTIWRYRLFTCANCGTFLPPSVVEPRRERGFRFLNCPVCDEHVDILDREERLESVPVSRVTSMDVAANRERDREAQELSLQGKLQIKRDANDFDVFLCHNHNDKPHVKQIAEQLLATGILPWLDEWELRPGLPWTKVLEEHIERIKCAAVFVGDSGFGPWHQLELQAFLRQFAQRSCPVIPVILPECTKVPKLPPFLEGMTWVDFRVANPNPLEQLIWGITGQRGPLDSR